MWAEANSALRILLQNQAEQYGCLCANNDVAATRRVSFPGLRSNRDANKNSGRQARRFNNVDLVCRMRYIFFHDIRKGQSRVVRRPLPGKTASTLGSPTASYEVPVRGDVYYIVKCSRPHLFLPKELEFTATVSLKYFVYRNYRSLFICLKISLERAGALKRRALNFYRYRPCWNNQPGLCGEYPYYYESEKSVSMHAKPCD